MSAQPASASTSARPRVAESRHVVSDVDLRNLRVRGVALELALLARQEAFRQGTLQPAISNVRAARELRCSVRSVQRAKRELEKAGVALIERRSRHVGERGSEHLAHRFQLDRRAIEALHDTTRPQLRVVEGGAAHGQVGVTEQSPPIGSSKPLEEEEPPAPPPPPEGRSRAAPPRSSPAAARPGEVECVTEAVGSALPTVAPHDGPPRGGTDGRHDLDAVAHGEHPASTGWRSALPEHVAWWMTNFGVHYAESRSAFVEEASRLPRFEPTQRQLEGYRQHLLREIAETQLALDGGGAS